MAIIEIIRMVMKMKPIWNFPYCLKLHSYVATSVLGIALMVIGVKVGFSGYINCSKHIDLDHVSQAKVNNF